MTTTTRIPAAIRETFQRIPVVDEHQHLFSQPTSPLFGNNDNARIEAVRHVGDEAAHVIGLHPTLRFMMEAQLEALEETFIQLGDRHPERFRETEHGLALIRNLEILLNGAQPDDCGSVGS